MIYCWYRCSKALPQGLSFDEKLKACLFLCDTQVPQILQFLPEDYISKAKVTLTEKLRIIHQNNLLFEPEKLVSFKPLLSKGMAAEEWLLSMLRQPALFIRLRKNPERVKQILSDNGIKFHEENNHCLSVSNGAPLDKILPQELYVVQDMSSQKTGDFFQPQRGEHWWDCCAGAGGKSLLLKDMQPDVALTVSDKRETILHNLSARFKVYNHKKPEKTVADISDLSALKKAFENRNFDNIICDAPCSGSGTWARTPEQLYFFEERFIEQFSTLQKKITMNATSFLKKGGKLFYITCSVFKQENETVVEHLLQNSVFSCEQVQIINGTDYKADSMFIAVLRKQ